MLYRASVLSVLVYWPDDGSSLEQEVIARIRLQGACCV